MTTPTLSPSEARDALLAHNPFPDGLTVGGDLYLRYCMALTHLPPGLIVRGDLSLTGCTALARD